MKPWAMARLTLVLAGAAVTACGCHQNTGAGSADPHHYTAEEARAAYQQHMQSAGGRAAQGRPVPGNASAPTRN